MNTLQTLLVLPWLDCEYFSDFTNVTLVRPEGEYLTDSYDVTLARPDREYFTDATDFV